MATPTIKPSEPMTRLRADTIRSSTAIPVCGISEEMNVAERDEFELSDDLINGQ
jgi:hypothetical protein